MGRILLVCRLAARDLRRRPAEAVLLLLTITAVTTALTLGLVLNGVINQPFQNTRDATNGPDIIASAAPPLDGQAADLDALKALAESPEVVDHSGPFPYSQATIAANGSTTTAWAIGRGSENAAVDQPDLTEGDWVKDGGAVIEASFADSLGIGTGDSITLEGRTFQVAGIAVTASTPPYPKSCYAPCMHNDEERNDPTLPPPDRTVFDPPAEAFKGMWSGVVWLTDADARSLVTQPDHLAYVMNLELEHSADVQAFVDAHPQAGYDKPIVQSWQEVKSGHSWVVEKTRETMLAGSALVGLIALASIMILAGGRMTARLRRVGQLKAVGGSPRLISAVLLAEYLAVALVASAAGLVIGRLVSPLFTSPGAGLLGTTEAPPITVSTVVAVTVVALAVATASTVVPVIRAARTSTVRALAASAHPPRRKAWLIALSARLPVPLLLGLRVTARRPNRTALGVVAVAITTCGITTVLTALARRYVEKADGGDPRLAIAQAMMMITAILIVQVTVNAVSIAWTTLLDTRHTAALTRALGATPNQASAAFALAQVIPAFVGSLVGLVAGLGLGEIVDEDPLTVPPAWQLVVMVLGTVSVVAVLTAIPARITARRPVGRLLQTELT